MKPRASNQQKHALTLIEVMLVIVVVAFLFAIFLLPALRQAKENAQRITCNGYLKNIGLSYRVWEGDYSNRYPMVVSVTNGGAMELIATGNVAACFRVMSNELSMPMILVCPADTERVPARNFMSVSNCNISYFINPDVVEDYPQMILSGDDNFEISGVAVKSGLLEFPTNTPISWTAKRHKFVGNLAIADGSVHQVTQDGLRQAIQWAGVATNRLAIP